MDHPFRNLGPVLALSLPLLFGFFLGLCFGPCRIAVAAGFLLLSLLLSVFRVSPIAAACAVAALCGALAADRLPHVDPETVRPFLEAEASLRGNVFQVRHTDIGWSGVVEGGEVSLLEGSSSLRLDRVLLSVRNPDATVSFPAGVRATGRLRAIESRGNPGEIPREWTALARGVQYRFYAEASRTVFLPMGEGDHGITGLFHRTRERTKRWLGLHAGDSTGALYLRAVATGEIPPPSHPVVVLLRRTGLAHLLAISGLHVVLFFSVQSCLIRCALWILRFRHGFPDLNRISALLSLPVCWAYALFAGSPVSAIRAAGMISVVVLLRHLLGIRGSGAAWTTLFLATIVYTPSRIFSPSFLLSYGASFFLIASFAGKRRDDILPPHPIRRAVCLGRNAVVGSVMAFLGTLPVSASFFEYLPAGAILWNVLFVPVLGTVGVTGALIGVVGGIFSFDILGGPVRIAVRILCASLSFLARASGDGAWVYPLPPSGIAAPLVCTGAAVIGSLWLRKRSREPWPAVVVASVAFLAWIHIPYAAMPDHRLTVTALNVGRGAAHVLSFPGGGHMIVDCGSALRGNIGKKVVLPYLRSRGIREIDVLVLTHPHEDHYGGAEVLLASVPVGEIWIPDGIPPAAFGQAVKGRADIVRGKSPGDRFASGGAEAIVRGTGKSGRVGKTNERSLVLEVRYGSFSVWLPGDVERGPSAWGKDTRKRKGGKRILFLPHHGSAKAKPWAWIRAASPDVIVSQNSDCFVKKNLLPSVQSLFLEIGAVTMRSDGNSVFLGQESRHRLWKLILRLPPTG
jgi:competence protein ComEC